MKGSRFLLLRNYHELPDAKKGRLDTLLAANQPLFTMHAMKEQFRLFWNQARQTTPDPFSSTGVSMPYLGHQATQRGRFNHPEQHAGLLGYYPHKITNGPLEGLNNKIKTMKRQAYGYRDMEYFKLRLYNLHNSRYAFAG